MASPFPGMDPFLEDSRLWESFHNRLIGVFDEILSARVRPHFYVEEQSSVYIVELGAQPRPPVKPDVYLVDAGRTTSAGATAIAERPVTQPLVVKARFPEELRQRYLEIRDSRNHTVVAVLELLSPTNKAAGTTGREAFLRKRRELMSAPVHWLEIDLLRAGERPDEVAGQSDYYALLKRAEIADEFDVWYWNLRDPLPVITVPLTAEFPDVAVDLQSAFATTYERYYAARLEYREAPPPPRLQPADLSWAAGCLEAWRALATER
jgi:Protein of unknown function (DUF4058)